MRRMKQDPCDLTDAEKVAYSSLVDEETRPGASDRISRQLEAFTDEDGPQSVLTIWAKHLWPRSLWRISDGEGIVSQSQD